MNSKDSSCPLGAASVALSQSVTLSPWINERFPDWEQLLSAHDVARLTRRPRWVIASLILVRRFPRKRRYHGRGVGWLLSDVIHWLAKATCVQRTAEPRTGADRADFDRSADAATASMYAALRFTQNPRSLRLPADGFPPMNRAPIRIADCR